ncbi:MAG: hypothetical protein ACRD8O_21080, partial [Bryobacteraceae bacterium]
MWTVDQTDFSLLRGGGGRPFTAFVDALIRTHAFVQGIGEAEILTCLRTNVGDGGVDTQVRRSMDSDPTEYFRVPTCWQYKATDTITDAELRREIQKSYSSELINKGYGYRFAICADAPALKQAHWEEVLTAEARKIYAQAPEARVATASQLASWTNQYPSLIPAFFRRDAGPTLFFEAWGQSITKATPTFVPVEAWRGDALRIESHITLIQPVTGPVITLQGMAGVGKTRLVYEILSRLQGASGLVVYTLDGDDAQEVARYLANNPRTRGILVADECPVESRAGIIRILKGHTDRIRVVCIDNTGERLGDTGELWLNQLPSALVETVLEKNFQWVPPDRRRTYAAQSGGYIRLAADMCEHDTAIQIKGHLGPALDAVQDYYRQRLPEERQRRAVEAVSLLQ